MQSSLKEEPIPMGTLYALDQYRNKYAEIKLIMAQFCEWYEDHGGYLGPLAPELEKFYESFKSIK